MLPLAARPAVRCAGDRTARRRDARTGTRCRRGHGPMSRRRLALLVAVVILALLVMVLLGDDGAGVATEVRNALRSFARALF